MRFSNLLKLVNSYLSVSSSSLSKCSLLSNISVKMCNSFLKFKWLLHESPKQNHIQLLKFVFGQGCVYSYRRFLKSFRHIFFGWCGPSQGHSGHHWNTDSRIYCISCQYIVHHWNQFRFNRIAISCDNFTGIHGTFGGDRTNELDWLKMVKVYTSIKLKNLVGSV